MQNRANRCDNILDSLSVKYLKMAIKALPKYKGKRKGSDKWKLTEAVRDHLDTLVESRLHSDLIQEEAMLAELGKQMEEEDLEAAKA